MSQDARPTDLRIDPATVDDVPTILGFIRELADYEKLSHEAVADEEDLRRTLFGERPYAEVRIARLGGKAVAFALFFHNYSTFLGKPGIYLEDLYVSVEHRGRGVGKALLAHLAGLAVVRGCGRFEWSVLDWNEPAIRFYEALGAVPMDEWTVYRTTGRALRDLADITPG